MLYAIGGALAIFMSFLLLGKKQKTVADKVLLLWMVLLGIHLFIYYTVYIGISQQYPVIYGIGLPLPFLHGPLLFLYTAARVGRFPKKGLLVMLHFLPSIAIYLYYFPFYLADLSEQLAYVRQIESGQADLLFRSVFFLMLASGIAYVAATLLFLRKYQSNIVHLYSNTEGRDLFWLRNLILGLGAVWAVVITVSIVGENIPGDNIIYASVVLFVVSLGYFGIGKAGIFSEPAVPVPAKPLPEIENPPERYQKSGLKSSQIPEIASALERFMQEDKLYLESNLSLKALSERSEIPSNHISQTINQHFDKNFHDFVNGYRLAAFLEKIKSGAHQELTLLALAYESGFSSKATFNKFFKKELGIPPSQHIRSMENEK